MPDNAKVGVAAIVIRDGKLLMQKRRNSHGDGTWSVPGGHIDFGETVEQCAIRETKEETDVDVGNVRVVGITNDVFEMEQKHYVTLWTVCDYLSGEAKTAAPREGSETAWMPLDALPSPRFLPLQHLLDGKATIIDKTDQNLRLLPIIGN